MSWFATFNDRLIAVLDRVAFTRHREPRPTRWLPLVILIALPVGYAMMFEGPVQADKYHGLILVGLGIVTFTGALALSAYARLVGPRLQGSTDNPLDERERMLRDRAGNIAGHFFSFLSMFGCMYFGFAYDDLPKAIFHVQLWHPRSIPEWTNLGLLLQGYFFILPGFIASWLLPREHTVNQSGEPA